MLKKLMAKCSLSAVVCSISLSAYAVAGSPGPVDVPAGELVSALKALARQSDVELVYQPEQLREFHTNGVKGTYSAQEAIAILLKGTELKVYTAASGAMIIAPASTSQAGGAADAFGGALPSAAADAGNLRVAQADGTSSAVSGSDDDSRKANMDEITVFGRGIKTTVRDVPQTVDVYDVNFIENVQATKVTDVVRFTPNAIPTGVSNVLYPIASHPEVDMVSFTGSTRAGIEVARNAAPTVKRVHQELGGKSPNVILPDADLKRAVTAGVRGVMSNSGQSCNAPTRMLVPNARMDEALALAKAAAEATTVGDPASGAAIGPVVSAAQWDKIQTLIHKGLEEGATLVAGGPGRPDGLAKGYYVRPTVLGHVNNQMTVAREEIFGPVLVVLGYDTVDEAVAIANDTPYGLAAYVSGSDVEATRAVAARLRAGQVNLNSVAPDLMAPFGGFKQSGNGREWGDHAFAEFLEVKAILGYTPKAA